MKRFILFSGDDYYPHGGWYDYQSNHDTLQEACKAPLRGDWAHVVDLTTGKVVADKVSKVANWEEVSS